ncbi:hypothetical protein [Sphingomonas sp. PAMC 26621]|uniref:hypothetical protein n=1 Tax=Sphingomonas sp. PAMC 26621 TaxID=1112213 RepID=UPI00028968FB|nr:hypothetical protein [Sphingomonas sp. PAMC 26621]
MTEETEGLVLGGTVHNGERVRATFTFYQGMVGIRDRGDVREVSFFATAKPYTPLNVQGLVDGKLVEVLTIAERHLDANGTEPRPGETRVVTLTVAPVWLN